VTEEDALNLLFIGDTNRVVSETPMNDASTRSHCIFLVQIESRAHGSDVNTVSRYHIVDLAGSESKLLYNRNKGLVKLELKVNNLKKQ
jgi:kinesin family protein 6/9